MLSFPSPSELSSPLAGYGIDLANVKDASREMVDAAAYVELHPEQGPVLATLGLPLGVVVGLNPPFVVRPARSPRPTSIEA